MIATLCLFADEERLEVHNFNGISMNEDPLGNDIQQWVMTF